MKAALLASLNYDENLNQIADPTNLPTSGEHAHTSAQADQPGSLTGPAPTPSRPGKGPHPSLPGLRPGENCSARRMQADQEGRPCRCQKGGEQGYWGQVPAHVMWRSGRIGACRPLLLGWHNMQMCMQVMELIKSKHCNPILVRLAWHDSGTYDKVNCLLEGWLAACQPDDARRGYALYAHLVCTPVLGVHAPRAGASGLLQTGECGGSSMEAYWDTAPSRSMHLPCRTSLSGPSAVEPMGL